jgi:hypothetical protein
LHFCNGGGRRSGKVQPLRDVLLLSSLLTRIDTVTIVPETKVSTPTEPIAHVNPTVSAMIPAGSAPTA